MNKKIAELSSKTIRLNDLLAAANQQIRLGEDASEIEKAKEDKARLEKEKRQAADEQQRALRELNKKKSELERRFG